MPDDPMPSPSFEPGALGRALGGRRRIPAPLWDAAGEAEKLLASAQAEARSVLEVARREADELRTAGAARGRDEGLASVTELHARALLDRDRLLEEARTELVELAFAIAARVIGGVVERHPEIVVETAARAIEASRGRVELVLRASPADLDTLRAAVPRLMALARGRPRVRLVEDAALARGGVVVETELGCVEASVEAQLAAVRRAVEAGSGMR